MSNWSPRTNEDQMLLSYTKRVGGLMFTEVPIAGSKGDPLWAKGSTTRRIDGVWFPAKDTEVRIFQAAAFLQELKQGACSLIEVKPSLTRGAIGQILVAKDLFTQQYGVTPARILLVCSRGDAALEWFCTRHHIALELVTL